MTDTADARSEDDRKMPPDNTGLVWDTFRCDCGGLALMGIMSLVAHCPNCPRVYATWNGKDRWFENIDAANKAYQES